MLKCMISCRVAIFLAVILESKPQIIVMIKNHFSVIVIGISLFLCACDGIDLNILQPSNDTAPVLSTLTVSAITDTTSVCGGNITNDGGSKILSQGVCYGLTTNPTLKDSVVLDKSGLTPFSCKLTHLKGGTTYYIRAYATNAKGTSYGNVVTFTTPNPIGYPVLSTNFVSMITTTSAVSGGVIASDGGSAIISKGICWGKNPNPTLQDSVMTDATVLSTFVCQLNHLTPNTSYYIRSFATNIKGTSYGNQVSFTSLQVILPPTNTVTDIDGNIYKTVTIGTQTWMAENLRVTHYQNGEPIPNISDGTSWAGAKSGAWCLYNNLTNNDTITKNGLLYNWYAASDNRNIAPKGWHVALATEWDALHLYVSSNPGSSLSGAKSLASQNGWTSNTTTGTVGNNSSINNSTGFNAIPGGYRSNDGTQMGYSGNDTRWWTSSAIDANGAWFIILFNDDQWGGHPGNFQKEYGFSVRCVKD